MPVPNTFATATTSIPLSQLDANFATAITIGNTAVQLGNTITTINNTTLANTTISSGNATVTKITVPTIDSGSATPLVFDINGAEKARIDTSGNFIIGAASTSYGAVFRSVFVNTSQVGLTLTDTATTYLGNYALFENSSGAVAGYIAHNGATTVNYVASSDYRLKENVKPLVNSLDRVLALNPVSYDWVEDKSYGEGFIAHELQEHIPLAVCGNKDAVNEDGSIKPQGVDYGKLTTVLVAAIKELSAEVSALKAKVGA